MPHACIHSRKSPSQNSGWPHYNRALSFLKGALTSCKRFTEEYTKLEKPETKESNWLSLMLGARCRRMSRALHIASRAATPRKQHSPDVPPRKHFLPWESILATMWIGMRCIYLCVIAPVKTRLDACLLLQQCPTVPFKLAADNGDCTSGFSGFANLA